MAGRLGGRGCNRRNLDGVQRRLRCPSEDRPRASGRRVGWITSASTPMMCGPTAERSSAGYGPVSNPNASAGTRSGCTRWTGRTPALTAPGAHATTVVGSPKWEAIQLELDPALPTKLAADYVALAKEHWRGDHDEHEPPHLVYWDSTKDAWLDGFETGYRAALAALTDGVEDPPAKETGGRPEPQRLGFAGPESCSTSPSPGTTHRRG